MIARFFSHRWGWLAVLVSLGIGVLALRTIWTMRQEQWSHYERTNTNLSITLAKGLEWSLDAVDLTLQKLAIDLRDTQVLEATEFPGHVLMLNALWRELQLHRVTVLDRHGRVLHRKPGGEVHQGEDWSGQAFFQYLEQAVDDGVYIGLPKTLPDSASLVLPIARIVRGHDGSFQGVVLGRLSMQEINIWLSSMNLGADSGLNLLRDDGLLVTRFPYTPMQQQLSIAGSESLRRFLAAPQGSFVAKSVLDGKLRLYTFQRVGYYPLIVNVAQSTETILKDWRRNAWELVSLAAVLMAGCIALAWLFTRELVRRENSEAHLFAEKERMRLTLQSIGDAVISTDAQGRIKYMNPMAQRMTGWSLSQAKGQPIECLHGGDSTQLSQPAPALLGQAVRRALERGESVERVRTVMLHHASGEQFDMEEAAAPVRNAKGVLQGAVAVLRDVTVAAAQEVRLQRLAFHDPLTGLPNRLLLQDRAQQALAQAARKQSMMAVVYLDLDGFKQINDTWGHAAGDAALVHAAKMLLASVRSSDTVCRLGGDEFVVLLTNVSSPAHLQMLADKLLHACAQPVQWQGHDLPLHTSGGISLYPDHATTWNELLEQADQALYAAKQAGRHQMRLYQSAQTSVVLSPADSAPPAASEHHP